MFGIKIIGIEVSQMKTLYISDLDGTLLNKNAEISEFTEKALSRIIENGLNFSVATARTSETALQMLRGLPLNVPIILMNGVSIYDVKNSSYIKTHFMQKSSVCNLFSALKKHNITGFLYIIEDEKLNTYYEDLNSDHAKKFVEERIRKFDKKFTHINNFSDLKDKATVYFSICDIKEKLVTLYQELAMDKNLHIEFYRDIYNEDFWYLEVCSVHASKYNAVKYLREEYGFDKVISFGDNLNDIPMFLASDESYAVANAKPEVKEKATAIIDSNDNDGVAKWLLQRSGLDKI